MNLMRSTTCWLAVVLFGLLSSNLTTRAGTQTLAPAGTILNSPHNYTWNRMTTINVSSGQIVPFVTYKFDTLFPQVPAGTYTITMNTVGFAGAINVYGVFFDPTQ